jgi:hypothetical protein
MPHTDPITLVDELDPDVIRARLTELDRQTQALRVLLRAALARQRCRPKPAAQGHAPRAEVGHA